MSASKASLTYILLPALLIFVGCTENANEGQSEDCTVESAGENVFSGTPECIAQFRNEQMSGYWLVDFETSLFFRNRQDLENGSIDDAYSMAFLEATSGEVSALLDSPKERVFRVSFEGSKSEIPGIYGSVPDLRGGVVVKEKFSIEGEVGDVPTIN